MNARTISCGPSDVVHRVHVIEFEVNGMPSVESASGADFIPEVMTVEYSLTEDKTIDVTVRGHRMKSDGSKGMMVAGRYLPVDLWPEWLTTEVTDRRPEWWDEANATA